jgi:hypothetical protein
VPQTTGNWIRATEGHDGWQFASEAQQHGTTGHGAGTARQQPRKADSPFRWRSRDSVTLRKTQPALPLSIHPMFRFPVRSGTYPSLDCVPLRHELIKLRSALIVSDQGRIFSARHFSTIVSSGPNLSDDFPGSYRPISAHPRRIRGRLQARTRTPPTGLSTSRMT